MPSHGWVKQNLDMSTIASVFWSAIGILVTRGCTTITPEGSRLKPGTGTMKSITGSQTPERRKSRRIALRHTREAGYRKASVRSSGSFGNDGVY